ncbi:counting factor associated protein D-like isoform X2 [Danio rerio]|uniref:Counting factor associated protein D-like isoform X2 n=1 Tax=Danio rerio TaxID=7955 RepID=A0A8M9P213_DANRE|nr:counting factor associated protein D-like isoform X2 [Danio rerio]|eukprot:XP_021323857.1 counting factor associated protein D-like isoform X2 [Danio rerio]
MAQKMTKVKPDDDRTVPDFGKMYHVKGVISLPSYEIEEPFEAWYDFERNRSRIDYYNGTKEEPIQPQSAMPDVQGFEFEKMDYHKGSRCEVWKTVTEAGHKKNTYRLWVTRPEGNDAPATPHRFEMEGFNTLLDSHNDKYSIEYSDFCTQSEPDVFTPPAGFTCEEFPDPPEEHQILANPIQDYVSTNPVSHAHRMFGPFKEKFNRQYKSEKEHEKREINFVQSFRFVNSTNRKGLSFTVGINDRADWSRAETRKYC